MRVLIPCLVLSLIMVVNGTQGYKVLVVTSSLGSKSHSIYLNSIAVELAKSGHQVTHLSSGQLPSNEGVEQHEVDLLSLPNLFDIEIRHLFQLNSIVQELINVTYSNKFIRELVKQPLEPVSGSPRYDVVLLDACFTEHLLPLIHRMEVPFILVAPSHSMLALAWNLNIPLSYAYFNYFGFHEPMSLLHRIFNIFANLGFILYFNSVIVAHEQSAVRKYFPDSPPLMEIQRNASVAFINLDSVVQDSIPSLPFIVPIPCPQCTPARPIPQDLEDMLSSSSEHGVIYFAMGTIVKAEWIPRKFINKMIRVLSELPQLVIWNCNFNETMPRNFRRVKWIPQQDLIAHHSVRLFINHAGLNSVQEAAYHGCPVLMFPICCDTFYSANQASKRGFGLTIDWRTISTAQLRFIIRSMLNDSRYERSAKHIRRVSNDRLSRPTRTAVYWVEYVARHRGARRLKMNIGDYRIHHFLLLDVLVAVGTAVVLSVITVRYACKAMTFERIRHFTHVKTFSAIIKLGHRYFGDIILIKKQSHFTSVATTTTHKEIQQK